MTMTAAEILTQLFDLAPRFAEFMTADENTTVDLGDGGAEVPSLRKLIVSFPAQASQIAAVQAAVNSITSTLGFQAKVFTTKAAMDGNLAFAADTIALVYADGTEANNRYYVKQGASGAGSWQAANDRITAEATARAAAVTAEATARANADTAEATARAAADTAIKAQIADVNLWYGAPVYKPTTSTVSWDDNAQLTLSAATNNNSYVISSAALAQGEKSKTWYMGTSTGSAVIAYLADGAANTVETVDGSAGGAAFKNTLICDGLFRSFVSTAAKSGGAAEYLLQQAAGGTFTGHIVHHKVTNMPSQFDQLAHVVEIVDAGTRGLGAVNSAPSFSGYDSTEVGGPCEFWASTTGVSSAAKYALPVKKNAPMTMSYVGVSTGQPVSAFLSLNNNTLVEAASHALVMDGEIHTEVFTPTVQDATHFLFQQVASSASMMSIKFDAWMGDVNAQSPVNFLIASLMARAKVIGHTQRNLNKSRLSNSTSLAALSEQLRNIIYAASPRLHPVSCRNSVSIATSTAGTNSKQSLTRVMNAGVTCDHLVVRVTNWYIDPTTGREVAVPNAYNLWLSIESPIGTTPKVFCQSTQIASGATVDFVYSDVSAQIVAGDFLITALADAGSGVLPVARFAVNPTGNPRRSFADRVAYGSAATNKTTTIGGETTALVTSDTLWCQFAILGRPVSGSIKSAVIFGDSILYGYNEHMALTADICGNVGWAERWLGAAGYGAINCAVPSTTAKQWSGIATNQLPKLSAALKDVATEAVYGLGTNDIGTGSTPEELLSYDAIICDYLRHGLLLHPYVSTIFPRASSTDQFVTTGNQTPYRNAVRSVANEMRRSAAFRPMAALGCIDAAVPAEGTKNLGKWIVSGSAFYATSADGGAPNGGLHPTGTLNSVVAAALPAPSTVFL